MLIDKIDFFVKASIVASGSAFHQNQSPSRAWGALPKRFRGGGWAGASLTSSESHAAVAADMTDAARPAGSGSKFVSHTRARREWERGAQRGVRGREAERDTERVRGRDGCCGPKLVRPGRSKSTPGGAAPGARRGGIDESRDRFRPCRGPRARLRRGLRVGTEPRARLGATDQHGWG